MRFFPKLVLTPVFPPTDESTCESNVVGTLINFKPLLNRLAVKDPISPVIPPPTVIRQSCLEKFLFSKIFNIEFEVFKFLFFSVAFI